VLAGQLISSLAYIDRLEPVLLPELEELFCHTERGAEVVDGNRHALAEFLQNRLQLLLRAQFFFFE